MNYFWGKSPTPKLLPEPKNLIVLEGKTLPKQFYKNQNQDTDKIAELNKYFQFYKSANNTWLTRACEYEMVVHNDVEGTGTQFTQQQLQEIKDKYLIGSSINISIAIIEVLQAFLTSSEPVPETVPVGESSKEQAYFWKEVIKACLNTNIFTEKQEVLVKDQLITGRGILQVKPANFFNYNEFNVILENLDFRCYFPDPYSKIRSHQDSERIFVATPLNEKRAQKIYNLTDKELTCAVNVWDGGDMSSNNPVFSFNELAQTADQTGERMVWIHEIYEKVQATMYILPDGTKTFEKPQAQVDSNGQLQNLVFDIQEKKGVFIKRIIKIGNFIKDEQILPINLYPFVIYSHTHNRRPQEYGVVHHFIDLGHAINKFIALCIENAMGSSNANWIAPKGAIDDPVKFAKERSKPNSISEYNADQNLPNSGKPEQNQPVPLNNAFYSLFKEFIALIEYITGVLPLLQGSSQGAPNTAEGTNTISNFGMQRPKLYARRIDNANSVLGKLIIQMYQAFAPEGNVLRYINNTSATVEIRSNIQAQVEQTQQGQQITESPIGNQKVSTVKIIEEGVQDKLHAIFGDISSGDYNVTFKSTGNLPTTRAQAIEFLKTLLGRMSNDSMSMAVTEALFRLADVAEADQILRDTNAINQMQGQLQQVTQQNEALVKECEKLQNKLELQIMATKEAEIESAVEIRKAKADALLKEMGEKVKEDKREAKKKQVEYS